MKTSPLLRKLKKTSEIQKKSEGGTIYSEDQDGRPEICFSETELPELKNWKVGEKYTLQIEVEQTAIKTCDYGRNKGKIEGQFKVIKVGVENEEEESE